MTKSSSEPSNDSADPQHKAEDEAYKAGRESVLSVLRTRRDWYRRDILNLKGRIYEYEQEVEKLTELLGECGEEDTHA